MMIKYLYMFLLITTSCTISVDNNILYQFPSQFHGYYAYVSGDEFIEKQFKITENYLMCYTDYSDGIPVNPSVYKIDSIYKLEDNKIYFDTTPAYDTFWQSSPLLTIELIADREAKIIDGDGEPPPPFPWWPPLDPDEEAVYTKKPL